MLFLAQVQHYDTQEPPTGQPARLPCLPVRLPPTAGPAAFAQRAKLPPPVQPVLPPSGPRTSCAPTPPPASPSVFWRSIELLAASAHLPRRNSHEHPPAAVPVPLPTSL